MAAGSRRSEGVGIVSQVDAQAVRAAADSLGGGVRHSKAERVKIGVVERREVACGERAGKRAGLPMYALADLAQTSRPVKHRVHGAHVGKQRLRRADVARGVLATDVLLARLQRQTQRAATRVVPARPSAHSHVNSEM